MKSDILQTSFVVSSVEIRQRTIRVNPCQLRDYSIGGWVFVQYTNDSCCNHSNSRGEFDDYEHLFVTVLS